MENLVNMDIEELESLDLETLKQMLLIAADDVAKITNCSASEYIKELSQRRNANPLSVAVFGKNAKAIASFLNGQFEEASNKYDKDDEFWNQFFDNLFSDDCIGIIYDRFGHISYYDPDTTCYEDSRAFIMAFNDFAENEME